MDIIIVCHTEFGFSHDKEIIFDKKTKEGVRNGSLNLVRLAEKHKAKITFAICPEVADFFPKSINQEIGLHLHPGWQEWRYKNFRWIVGDAFLKEHCEQSRNSTVLSDYPYPEQFEMIKTSKEYLKEKLGQDPKVFVAGRWSLNNDTIRALIETGFTHDCSAPAHSKSDHYDWSKLPRICLPYHPGQKDYQEEGNLSLLIVPISQTLGGGTVSPEGVIIYGLKWLKACFSEYYQENVPFFHICLHSPSMTDSYFLSVMNDFLSFISKHKNINFRFASEIKEYPARTFRLNILPYIFAINRNVVKTLFKKLIKK